MDIIRNTNNYAGKDFYKLTKSNSVKRMSDIDETDVVTVNGFVIYHDDESDADITAIDTDNGAYATNSATFRRTLEEIADIMGEFPIDIKVGHGVSKNGRAFIFADLV